MPLRRRPPEPSPRLRALLASTSVSPGSRQGSEGTAGSGDRPRHMAGERTSSSGSHEPARGRTRASDPPLTPWQPDRDWIAGTGAGTDVGSGTGDGAERPRGAARGGRHRRPGPPRPRFLTLPEALAGARWSGPRAAVAGLLVIAVLASVGFGVRVAWARAASTPEVIAPAQPGSAVVGGGTGATGFASSSTASGGGGPPGAAAATGGGATRAAGLTVHLVGQVKKPGILTLPAGSRVADAVARAGGALKGADLAAVNLARPLVDGEQVRIPKPGESALPADGTGSAGGAAGGSGGSGGSAGGSTGGAAVGGGTGGAAGVKLDLNRATAAELEELPGVGPVLAQRILDWRTEHGRFASVDELGEVSGIGEKIFSQLQPKVTV